MTGTLNRHRKITNIIIKIMTYNTMISHFEVIILKFYNNIVFRKFFASFYIVLINFIKFVD